MDAKQDTESKTLKIRTVNARSSTPPMAKRSYIPIIKHQCFNFRRHNSFAFSLANKAKTYGVRGGEPTVEGRETTERACSLMGGQKK